ncbi:MAG: Hsp20/alpha crystallin family protein [Victivallales bacterium]|nr:Hsp20/alpha crystallin family protein [Victivallales bacterium]
MFGLTKANNNLFPWKSFDDLHREFFDAFRGFDEFMPRRNYPETQVESTDTEIKLRACLPGYEADEIDIQILNDFITISAAHKEEKETGADRALRTERFTGEFKETFKLGARIDRSKATASYKNGILELTLPKLESEKPHKILVG